MKMGKTALLPLVLTFLGICLLSAAYADSLCVHASDSAGSEQIPSDASDGIPFLCDENGIITGIDETWLAERSASGEHTVILEIPSSVDKIPVTGIGPQAFWAGRYEDICPGLEFTGLKLPDTGLLSIGESAFYGCKGLGNVLFLPGSLKTVGSRAFYDTSFSTIHLPVSDTSYGESSFGGASLRSLICPDQEAYLLLSSQNIVDPPDRLTYPVTLQFQDEDGWTLADPREALYHMPLDHFPQEDGSWEAAEDYVLPPLADSSGAYTWSWVFDPDHPQPVSPSTLITGDVLTAVKSVSIPQIAFGEDIHKTYDQTPSVLSVEACHPLASSVEGARDGSVLFHYTWTWKDENGQALEEAGYDLSSLEFTEACRLTVTVLVRASLAGSPDSILEEWTHTFHVQIRQAEPEVKVETPAQPFLIGDGLPELSLKDGSTPGSLEWAEGQTPSEGVHGYQWIFTPQDPRNYTPLTGTLLLDARRYPPSAARADSSSGTPLSQTEQASSADASVPAPDPSGGTKDFPPQETETVPVNAAAGTKDPLFPRALLSLAALSVTGLLIWTKRKRTDGK